MITEMLSAKCCFPIPMVAETERQRQLEQLRLNIWRNGFVIEKEWRQRNPVFDKKDERTTTMMQIRPAKTKDEADFIASKIAQKGLYGAMKIGEE